MIDRSRFMRKPISFEINIGNAGSKIFPCNTETYDYLLSKLFKHIYFNSFFFFL